MSLIVEILRNMRPTVDKFAFSNPKSLTANMLLKVPSVDWTDQIIYVVDDDESLSDIDDEPDFSEYMWMENEEEFDKNVRLNLLFMINELTNTFAI